MNKAEKQQYIENLDQMSKDYFAIFVASFSEMSVKEMIEFRTEIRNNGGVTKVSKNNIVKIFVKYSLKCSLKCSFKRRSIVLRKLRPGSLWASSFSLSAACAHSALRYITCG